VFYPAVPQLGQAQAIAVSAGEEAQVELVMREVRTVEISGRVIGADGTLIDASINLVGDDYGSEQYAFTDANGNFSLKHIPPGSYVLFAFQRTHDDKTYRAQQKLEIGNDNIDSLVLVLGGGTNFSGRITVLGSPSVRRERLYISLTPIGEGGSSGNSSHAKKDGTFEITDVKEGSYAIFVGGPDEGWYTKSVRLGSDDVLANGLQVEKGSFGGTLEIVISTGTALLEGSVTCNDKPLIGAHVHLALDPESPYNKMRSATVSTDQNGHFSVQVAPGKYQVVARSSGLTGETAVTSDPRTVTLSEQEHKTIQLTIAPQTK